MTTTKGESVSEKFVDLSKIAGLEIKSMRVKALTGDDVISAAGRCAPMDGSSVDATVFSLMLRQQQLAQSIVEVDGQAIRGPFLQIIKMTTRTREYAQMIYDSVNGISMDEREAFQAALTKTAESATSTPAVESASG